MTDLSARVQRPDELTAADHEAMFAVMDLVYDRLTREHFETDLAGKDEVIVLRDSSDQVAGFSTQRIVRLELAGRRVTGVFSGDTVIHPAHWGSLALMQAFARRYIVERAEPWYWFLISKGHRTYRMLPTFFTEFWPSRHATTPPDAQAIMDAYAAALYGDEYQPDTGVLHYGEPKDRLRDGIAGVTPALLRNPDVRFFAERNPDHERGDDLVCLTVLSPENLRPQHRGRLLGDA